MVKRAVPQTPPDLNWVIWTLGRACSIPGSVIFLLLIARWLRGWYDDAMSIGRGARSLRVLSYRLIRLGPVRSLLTLLVTALVLVAQTLVVLMCYIAGNYMSVLLDPVRRRRVEMLFDQGWRAFLRPESLRHVMVTDWISGGYAALAIVVILLAYAGSHWAVPGAYVIGAPGWLMLGMAYVGGVLLLLVLTLLVGIWLLALLFTGTTPNHGDFVDVGRIVLQYLLPAATVALYAYSSRWAVTAAGVVRDSWRGRLGTA